MHPNLTSFAAFHVMDDPGSVLPNTHAFFIVSLLHRFKSKSVTLVYHFNLISCHFLFQFSYLKTFREEIAIAIVLVVRYSCVGICSVAVGVYSAAAKMSCRFPLAISKQ
jgi:hypothetical protein